MSTAPDFLPLGYWIDQSPRNDCFDPFFYDMRTAGGSLKASFAPDTGIYKISRIDVAEGIRRQGIGSQLVRSAVDHASSLAAEVILSSITSRECYELMARVIGSEHIEVLQLGSYAVSGKNGPEQVGTAAELACLVTNACKSTSGRVG